METRCFVYIAASVDGFIARPDDDVEWLDAPRFRTTESYGVSYEEFIADIDAIVMGRRSFEKVLTFGAWPYEGTPVVVVSSRDLAIPPDLEGKARVMGGEPAEVVARLAEEDLRSLYVDGGVTIQRFLRAGLIDELTITRIPVLLGAGIPLFGELVTELELELVGVDSADNGFVQSRYRVSRT